MAGDEERLWIKICFYNWKSVGKNMERNLLDTQILTAMKVNILIESENIKDFIDMKIEKSLMK